MGKGARLVTENYLSTTSSRRGAISRLHYERALPGLRRLLGPWVPREGMRVLDLGCGLGEMLYLGTSLHCQSAVGVDICQEEIDVAKGFVDATFVCADIVDYLRGSNDTFDWIGAFNILEHLEKDALVEVLLLASQRLAHNGTLVAMVPNAISPFGGVTRYWDFTHEGAFAPNNFRQLAPITGYSPRVEFRECGPVVHGVVSGMRWLLWRGIRLGIRSYLQIETADAKDAIYTMDMLVRLRKAVDARGVP